MGNKTAKVPVQFENLAQPQNTLPVATNQADALIQIGITQGIPVESLKELVALRNDELKRLAKGAFVRAMAKFQSLVPIIEKKKAVKFNDVAYKHATLSQIASAIKEAMQACDLSYRWEIKDEPTLLTVTCVLTHADGHSETTSMSGMPDNSGKKNAIQQRGSTITYLQRYTLIGALGLTTADEDVDGQQAAADEDFEPISDEQYTELHAVLTDGGIAADRVLPWLNKCAFAVSGSGTIHDLPADKFAEAKAKLQAGVKESQNGSRTKAR
jgi:hypothetical protein